MYDQLLRNIVENAPAIDITGAFPDKEFEWIAAAGLLKIVLPGQLLDFGKQPLNGILFLLKNIGAANLSVGRIYEGHINALQLIAAFATEDQKSSLFNDVQQDKLFGVWNSENGNGVEIHAMPDGRYRLTGTKIFCSGAHWINRPLVTGKLFSPHANGWQMCIIPTEHVVPFKEDGSFWKPMGMRASASFKIDFTDIILEQADLLGAPDSYYKEPSFNGGAVRFAAVQLGGAMAIINATHQFLKQHHRTETDFQRARIAEMVLLEESGNNWLKSAAEKANQWEGQLENIEKNTAYAGMVRIAIENICSKILYLSGVCIGPIGLMQPNVLERLHRDLSFYIRQPGPDAIVAEIGKYLFKNENIKDAWK